MTSAQLTIRVLIASLAVLLLLTAKAYGQG